MTITISRSALAQAMALLARTVERRTSIPILSNVRLVLHGETLALTSTNLDREASTTVSCSNSEGITDETTTPAHLLHDILRKLPDGTLTLTRDWHSETAPLIVKSGRARFQLPVLLSGDFPTLDVGDLPHTFTLEAKALLDAMKPVAFAISDEETRYYLNGIYLHELAGNLVFVATDGHRLARTTLALPTGAAGLTGVIIPRGAVAEIIRLAEDEGGAITISASAQKLRAKAGNATLITKLIDGTFPDYERVIPRENPFTAKLHRTALAEAVARVSVVAAEKSRGMALEFDKAKLTLTMANPDAGTAVEELDMAYDAESMRVGFNASYLAEILSVLKGEEVIASLRDAGSPAILTCAAMPDLTIVLMPMRVTQ